MRLRLVAVFEKRQDTAMYEVGSVAGSLSYYFNSY